VINASQQVLARDVIIEVERVEKFVLSAAQLTHHDESLPSIDIFQDTEQSARRQTFSTQSGKVRPMNLRQRWTQHAHVTDRNHNLTEPTLRQVFEGLHGRTICAAIVIRSQRS
jgi:hypothetical protein